jgi:hypothetical protein
VISPPVEIDKHPATNAHHAVGEPSMHNWQYGPRRGRNASVRVIRAGLSEMQEQNNPQSWPLHRCRVGHGRMRFTDCRQAQHELRVNNDQEAAAFEGMSLASYRFRLRTEMCGPPGSILRMTIQAIRWREIRIPYTLHINLQ